jgi:hypothetical protein
MAVVELNRVGPESAAVPLRGIREALHRLRAVESTLQMLRVLRKLHVKNRAQAVSCYMRLRALPRAA